MSHFPSGKPYRLNLKRNQCHSDFIRLKRRHPKFPSPPPKPGMLPCLGFSRVHNENVKVPRIRTGQAFRLPVARWRAAPHPICKEPVHHARGGFSLAKVLTQAETAAAGRSKPYFHTCLRVISCYPSSCPSALGLFRFRLQSATELNLPSESSCPWGR